MRPGTLVRLDGRTECWDGFGSYTIVGTPSSQVALVLDRPASTIHPDGTFTAWGACEYISVNGHVGFCNRNLMTVIS